jgi:hypothetical protein
VVTSSVAMAVSAAVSAVVVLVSAGSDEPQDARTALTDASARIAAQRRTLVFIVVSSKYFDMILLIFYIIIYFANKVNIFFSNQNRTSKRFPNPSL